MCPTSARRVDNNSVDCSPLYVAFELGDRHWTLGFTVGVGQRPRRRVIRARALDALWPELAQAKQRFGLAPDAPVRSCYEAGLDGFWLHRALRAHGVANLVVDASSIEVNRRARRVKADALDVAKLAEMLVRYHAGEQRVWHVVRVPSVADEDRRHLERERATRVQEHTRLVNRIRGLLATQGLVLPVRGDGPAALARVRLWDGRPLPPGLHARLLREWERVERVAAEVRALEAARRALLTGSRAAPEAEAETAARAWAQQLLKLRAIGPTIAWAFSTELFAWRQFHNRREVGAVLGMVPTPYQSGTSHHEQGISRSGNARLRGLAVELAWMWLRYQPQSALSQWYTQRFAGGGPRLRRIGIVALARKLVIALWRYGQDGQLPAGALLKPAGVCA
ncbi:MAG TPA: IS110 family transposase [Gemmatimonadaceae bacterium]|nr:IS110 family transposase [Gemmatimonadaceae bacterium]